MPTVPVYVPIAVSRQIASRWQLDPSNPDLAELIRSLCVEALDLEAGITHSRTPFSAQCEWEHLHRAGRRCRHCGGS